MPIFAAMPPLPRTLPRSTADGRAILLRRATPDDAAPMLAYLARVGGETPYLTFGAEGIGATEEEQRDWFARVAIADNAIAILAVTDDGGEIAGCLTFEGGPRPRIRHIGEFGISVARDFWGAGIGRALIEELLAWAAEGGIVHKILLKVRADNARAISLYERLGFVTEGRITREILTDGVYHDALVMGMWVEG